MPMNKLLFGFWIGPVRNAEGVDGGGAGVPDPVGAGAGVEAGSVVAGAEPAAATSFLSAAAAPAKGTEGAAPATEGEAAPAQTFDLATVKLPEGFELDEALGKDFSELLGKALPPQELGQALIDLHAKTVTAVTDQVREASQQAWTAMNESWQAEIAALPEFKANPDAEAGKVHQGLLAVGADETFFKALDLTGAGNHPAIVQVLHRLVQPFLEGGPVGGNPKPNVQRQVGSNIYTSAEK